MKRSIACLSSCVS